MKKVMADVVFIVLSAIILIALNRYGLLEEYYHFALIPILIAYYSGQFVVKKIKPEE